METLKIMNYNDESFDTGIDLEDVERVHVTILTGDELLYVTLKNGETIDIDSATLAEKPRLKDYYDGRYEVDKKDLPVWNHRSGSYAGQDMMWELNE